MAPVPHLITLANENAEFQDFLMYDVPRKIEELSKLLEAHGFEEHAARFRANLQALTSKPDMSPCIEALKAQSLHARQQKMLQVGSELAHESVPTAYERGWRECLQWVEEALRG